MTALFFLQVVAAVFVGGLLLAMFLWAGWTSVRLEREGKKQTELPARVYLMLALPLVFILFTVPLIL